MLPISSTREEILVWLREAYAARKTRPNGPSVEYIYDKDIIPNFELFVQKVGSTFESCLWAIKQLATFVDVPKRSQRLQQFIEVQLGADLTFDQITQLLPYAGRKHTASLIEKALKYAERNDHITKQTLITFLQENVTW